jgi:hypothetical protein
MTKFVARVTMVYFFRFEASSKEKAEALTYEEIDPSHTIDFSNTDSDPRIYIMPLEEFRLAHSPAQFEMWDKFWNRMGKYLRPVPSRI